MDTVSDRDKDITTYGQFASNDFSPEFCESIQEIQTIAPSFANITQEANPLKWESIYNYFMNIRKVIMLKNCRINEKLSNAIVGCYFECLEICNGYDAHHAYVLLQNLCDYLAVSNTLLFRILYYFCFHKSFDISQQALRELIFHLSATVGANNLLKIYSKLEEEKFDDISCQRVILGLLKDSIQINMEKECNISILNECNNSSSTKIALSKLRVFLSNHELSLCHPSFVAKVYNQIKTILKGANNNDVILLSFQCLCLIPEAVMADIKFFINTYALSPSLCIRNELFHYLSAVVQREPELFQSIEVCLRKTLAPDKVARSNLSSNPQQCICSLQWYHSHQKDIAALHKTFKMIIVETIFPLFTSQNTSFFQMMVAIINALDLDVKDLKNQRDKQKSDTINYIVESFPRIFYDLDLPSHVTPKQSPLHPGSPQKKFTFDNITSSTRAESPVNRKHSNVKTDQIGRRNGREHHLCNDFTKLTFPFVKDYIQSVTSLDVCKKLFENNAMDCYSYLKSRWTNNLGLDDNPLYTEVDLFLLFFSYKLLHINTESDRSILYNNIHSFCSFYNEVEYTRKELDVILVGLFYQNVDQFANPLITEFMTNALMKDVIASVLSQLKILLHMNRLAEESEQKKKRIVLGLFEFLSTQVINDEFCAKGKQSYAQAILDVLNYSEGDVLTRCHDVIKEYCNAAKFKSSTDLRYLMKQCYSKKKIRPLKRVNSVTSISSDQSIDKKEKPKGITKTHGSLPDEKKTLNKPKERIHSPEEPFSREPISIELEKLSEQLSYESNESSNLQEESLIEDEQSIDTYRRNTLVSPIRDTVSQHSSESKKSFHYDNSNPYLVVYETYRRSTIVHDAAAVSELSSDDSILDDSFHDESDSRNSIANPSRDSLYTISRILEVTVTFYQCVPYITIIKEDYSALYDQLNNEFNTLMEFLSNINSDIETFWNFNNSIISAVFKLFKLCLNQFMELPMLQKKSQETIDACKRTIVYYRTQYCQTHDPHFIEEAQSLVYSMRYHRILLERYSRELNELELFMQKLTEVVSWIISSPFVTDICGNISILTLFYILSVYFFSLENYQYEGMKEYEKSIFSFLSEIISNSNPVDMYTCILDLIVINGESICPQPWNDFCTEHAVKILETIHDYNIKKSTPYNQISLHKVKDQINSILRKPLIFNLNDKLNWILEEIQPYSAVDPDNTEPDNPYQNRRTTYVQPKKSFYNFYVCLLYWQNHEITVFVRYILFLRGLLKQ